MSRVMNKKIKKHPKPKARKPRGFQDRLGAELTAERDMLARISAVYEAHGFDPLETPAFEFTDALGKFLPDVDRPGQGVFSLQDDDEQWMSLRYDLTAPLARYVAEHYDALPKPFRRYAVGQVWRNEKPGPGRFRQFTQCDADTVGAPAPHADVEMAMLFADVIEAAGLARGDYVIRLNDRRLLTGLLETTGLDGDSDAAANQRLTALRALDKLDRLGEDGVRLLLGEGRKDESGDYTDGAKLGPDQIDRIMTFVTMTGATNEETCARLGEFFDGNETGAAGAATMREMTEQLAALGYDEKRCLIDLSIIRGLEYYTGPVFEADLLFETKDEKGRPVRLGSVGGGGRYDGLVARFKGQEVPAVGISVGVSRLMTALTLKGSDSSEASGPIVILALEKDQMAEYQKMARELREAGVRAEVFVGGGNFAKQLKYADKRAAPLAIIQGSDEREAGEVQIKDLVLGAKLSQQIEDNKEWREEQPAQFTVKRGELVDAVKKRLAG